MRSATGQIVWDAAAASHLLSRAAFGGAPGEADRLAAGTLEDAVDSLLDAAAGAPTPPAPDWVRDPWVNTERRYADTPREESSAAHRATQRRYDEELNSLRCWWLGEMIGTPAPLREVMTLFWHGHFTTATGKVRVSQAIYQQNATLRRLALGNFRELLGEVTRDAAMMMYLDLEDSDRSNPNENYARELLELFTLGIGRYGEPDIKEAARALTGWTLDAPPGPPRRAGPPPPAPPAGSPATAWSPRSGPTGTTPGPRPSWAGPAGSALTTSSTSPRGTGRPPRTSRRSSSRSSGRTTPPDGSGAGSPRPSRARAAGSVRRSAPC